MTALDLFAGAGGFTEGARLAGVRVVWAANHWSEAVEVHRQAHPAVEHACQDLHQADWTAIPRAPLLLASPSCQGHARARGRERPHHDAARATAWAVVSCAEVHRPRAVIVENVPEFTRWVLFPAWCAAMETLGYHLTIQVLDAADAGVPQNRERVFVVGTRGRPLEIPAPRLPHVPAASFLDLGGGRWNPVRRPGRAAATLLRIEGGRAAFGSAPFLISYYGQSHGGRSIDRPIGTITTRDRWAIVRGDEMRMLTPDECRKAMAFPEGYPLPRNGRLAVHLLGNAVPPPLAAHVIRHVMEAVA